MTRKHRLTYTALTLISDWLSKRDPAIQYWYAHKLAQLFYNHLVIRQKEARKNIAIAFPRYSEARRELILKNSYIFFIRNTMQFLSFPKGFQNAHITVNGKEYLDKALTKKKGVILVTGHFGVWEIMLAWFGLNQYSMLVVGQKQKNSGADTFVNQLRENTGIKMIPRKSSLEFMYEALARNNILTLASDQDAKKRGIFVKFFSLPASTPKGAGRFHLEYGSPLIFVTCHLERPNNHVLDILPIPTDSNSNIASITQSFTLMLENIITAYPEQYFWFHRRWKTKQPQP
jgi:KDO2-lipid IV(A) lauroyltransferase|tara:strand:+ start:865 stop:1728 length:864 start_codon:yes stop_codon:yes gene_type:complete